MISHSPNIQIRLIPEENLGRKPSYRKKPVEQNITHQAIDQASGPTHHKPNYRRNQLDKTSHNKLQPKPTRQKKATDQSRETKHQKIPNLSRIKPAGR